MAELTTAFAQDLAQRMRERRVQLGLTRSSLVLWALALLSGGLILLPLAYLLLRLSGAEGTVWGTVFQLRTLETLARTLALALTVTFISALIAVPLAWLTTRTDVPLRRLWALLTPLPLVIPSYVGAYLMVASLGPRGVFAQLVPDWLGWQGLPSVYGFPGAVYVLTMLSYPYILLSVRAGLTGMDPALEEAARGLGSGPWRTFWKVTLPQLRPALAAGGLLVCLYVLRDFGAVSIMRYNTFTRVIYVQYQSTFDRTGAAALALLLVVLTLFILGLEARTRGRGGYHSLTAAARPRGITRLGRWRIPAALLCAAVAVLALLIPAGVLAYWLIRGWMAGEQLASLWGATGNSLAASGLAALVVLAAALPVALVSVRKPGRLSANLERLAYAGFALPGIVVALALVFFGSNYAPGLYQTLPLLLLAYTILFLPQAVGQLRARLLQIHPNLEEAARGLGHKPAAVLRHITLPLMRPGTAAAAGLIFLTAMKELPATLILSPLGFRTLATTVWGAVSEAFFARAAGPALLLILISSVPMALLTFRERP